MRIIKSDDIKDHFSTGGMNHFFNMISNGEMTIEGEEHHHEDLSHVLINHGENKKSMEQSHVSEAGGSFQTSKSDKDKDKLHLSSFTKGLNAYERAMYSSSAAARINAPGGHVFTLIENMNSFTESNVDLYETRQASSEAIDVVAHKIEGSSIEDTKSALNRAPQNDDGTYMTKEQRIAFEKQNNLCMAPTVEEHAEDYKDAMRFIQFEKSLADPTLREQLTAQDVPNFILDQVRDQRFREYMITNADGRNAAFAEIVERHGIQAAEGLTAYEVYLQADNAGTVPIAVNMSIRNDIMDYDSLLKKEFDTKWEANIDSHAQSALSEFNRQIDENNGIYISQVMIPEEKLEDYKKALVAFESSNSENLQTALISDFTLGHDNSPTSVQLAATTQQPNNAPVMERNFDAM